ncbi:ATP-binding protein [Candidatus Palauibacter sp.]|uniref:ATP-binding protein n=1 Tax=Candidatus Palauibacter sp. TaxID=3101350 RepID=UPI003B029A58
MARGAGPTAMLNGCYEAELRRGGEQRGSEPSKFLDRVLVREIERKDERCIVTSLRLSGLPVGKTLEGFDWTFQPTADRSKLEPLATCAVVREADNVLFMGPARRRQEPPRRGVRREGPQERVQHHPLPPR